MAQRNLEWYSVHTFGVALREMAQRNVEWYSVHTNSVALREMANWLCFTAKRSEDSSTQRLHYVMVSRQSSHSVTSCPRQIAVPFAVCIFGGFGEMPWRPFNATLHRLSTVLQISAKPFVCVVKTRGTKF